MIVTREITRDDIQLFLRDQQSKQVQDFRYLGGLLNDKSDYDDDDIKIRIAIIREQIVKLMRVFCYKKYVLNS